MILKKWYNGRDKYRKKVWGNEEMRSRKQRKAVQSALMTAAMAVLSQITVPIPLSLVPFTGSLIGVYLCAVLLDKGAAFLSQILYLVLGLIGLPVFAGFKGGIGVLFGATGGFLLAFPLMSFFSAWLLEKWTVHSFFRTFLALLPSLGGGYFLGGFFYAKVAGIGVWEAWMVSVIPFAGWDFLKIALVAGLAEALAVPLGKAEAASRYLQKPAKKKKQHG